VKLCFSIHELVRFLADLASKTDLTNLQNMIMSAISEFAGRQAAFNDRIDTAIANVQADVAVLQETITRLQNTPGAITPEDQALLDSIETRAQGITDKLEALDALTPPVVPAG
jgi:hypothetical protein